MKIILVENGSLEKLSTIRDELLQAIKVGHPFLIELSDQEYFDLSLIQLLYGLDKKIKSMSLEVKLQGPGVQRLEKMRRFAGLPPFEALGIHL